MEIGVKNPCLDFSAKQWQSYLGKWNIKIDVYLA